MNYISTSLMLVANKLCSLPDSNETGIILAGPPSMAILLGLLVVFRNGSHLEQEVLSVPSTTHTHLPIRPILKVVGSRKPSLTFCHATCCSALYQIELQKSQVHPHVSPQGRQTSTVAHADFTLKAQSSMQIQLSASFQGARWNA